MKKKKIQKKAVQQLRHPFIVALSIVLIIMIATITYKLLHSANDDNRMMQQTTDMQQEGGFSIDTSLTFHKSNNSIAVMIDTGTDTISGVQLDMTYDPKVLNNVKISQGTLLTDPLELQNVVDQNTGSIKYVLAMKPNGQPFRGKGTIATISYTDSSGKPTRITVNPLTKVTTLGANTSVLKSFESITVQ